MKVMLGMPCDRDIPPETVISLLQTFHVLASSGVQLVIRFEIGVSIVEKARFCIMHSFKQSDCEYLFWVDSDMVWRATDFVRILEKAQTLECVTGIATSRKEPLMYCFNDRPESEWKNGCKRINSVGLAFTCLSRKACLAVADASPKSAVEDIPEMAITFRVGPSKRTGRWQGEDLNFCEDLDDLGFSIWADPDVVLGHVGQKIWSGPPAIKKENAS